MQQMSVANLFIMRGKQFVEPDIDVAVLIEPGWIVDRATAERSRTRLQSGNLQFGVVVAFLAVFTADNNERQQ